MEQSSLSGAEASQRPRLMISQLVLENFKSYGGKKVIGPFHKRFSSIVGPNGSGKSNVIDAMLFVFGKRAKKLRLKKVSELIHRSAKYPDLDFARVSVHFQDIVDTGDGDDDFEIVEGSEIVVSRTALRNNTSKYRVDGKEMKFKEVGALLRHRGIDLDHNRFLILQGEVEQISMMRPKAPAPAREATGPSSGAGSGAAADGEEDGGKKSGKDRQSNSEDGLLEFLEDIIGSNRFVEPIEEAQGALEEAQSARAAAINRVKTAQNEAESLKDAKEEAEALLMKQKETLRTKAHMYQVMLAEQEVQILAAETQQEAFELRVKEEKHRLAEVQEQNEELAKEEKRASAALQEVDARLADGRGKKDAFEKRDIQLREDVKALKSAAKKTQASIKKESSKEADAAKKLQMLEASIPELQKAVDEAEAGKASAEEALEELHRKLQGSTAGIREELSAAESALAPLAGRKAEAAAALETAKAELQVAKQESETAREALRQLQSQAAKTDLAAQNAARGIEGARATVARCEGRIPAARTELDAVTAEEKQAAQSVRTLRGKVEEARHALAQGSRSSELVQRLMQASRKGGELAGAGLHGRLGDLGDVPADMDVAVSTAAPALNYLVVDSTDGGQRCIEYLRRHNLGRARFVVLDRIRWAEKKMAEPVTIPAGTRRLFDLVRPAKAKFASAFYFAMRNTLVSPDMDSAIKVAFQNGKPQWRVVTVQGQLIESSGAMSGGGKAVRKGAMRMRSDKSAAGGGGGGGSAAADRPAESGMVSPEEMDRMSRELGQAEALVVSCRHRIASLQSEIQGLEEALEQARLDLQKHQSAAASLQTQLGDVRARLADAEEAAQEEARSASKGKAAEAIRSLERAAEMAERNLAEASQAASAAEARVASLREQVVSAGGAALREAQAAAKDAKSVLAEAAKALTKSRTDAKTQQRTISKAGAAAAKAQEQFELQQAKVQEMVQQLIDMEVHANEVQIAVESAESDREQAVAALDACKSKREAAEQELGSIKSSAVEIEGGLKEVKQSLKTKTAQKEQWTAMLAQARTEYAETVETLLQFADEEGDGQEPDAAASSASGASESKEMDDEGSEIDGPDGAPAQGSSHAATTDASAATAHDKEVALLSEDDMARMREEGRTAERLNMEVAALQEEMQRMKDGVNMKAIEEYYGKRRDYLAKVAQMDAASADEAEKRTAFEGLRKERLDMFMTGFATISLKLKEMYRMITLGGDAELELVDSLDPFNEGIVFSVRPPKKSWKQIANLSGGEKTLSSLALIFALHHYKPTPLYVMDEIDAALDFRNVSIVANYIKERTQDAQFIVISLRNNMFELADRLVGIYKTFDVTKSVTIAPRDFAGPPPSGAASTIEAARGGGGGAAAMIEDAHAVGHRAEEGTAGKGRIGRSSGVPGAALALADRSNSGV